MHPVLQEPFSWALVAFHALLLSLVVALRAQTTLQLALLCILALLLVLSRRLNEFGKQNWRLFASRDYFDKGGLFLTAVWAVPLLLVMLVQVAIYLSWVSHEMVKLKAIEMRGGRRRGRQ